MRTPAYIPVLSLLLASCSVSAPPVQETELPAATGTQVELVEEVFEEPVSAPSEPETMDYGGRLLPSGLLEIGNPNARVTLMMFTEHHCAYCKEFHEEQMPLLLQDFIEQGTLKMQIGILPLKKYLDSDLSAIGLLCAARQTMGLGMHGALFREGVNADSILQIAGDLKLDTKAFGDCLKSEDTLALLSAMRSLAGSLDVTLVPTFFIDGEKSVGLPYYPDLRGAIEARM